MKTPSLRKLNFRSSFTPMTYCAVAWFVFGVLLAAVCGRCVADDDPHRQILADIRAAMAHRDLPGGKAKLQQAAAMEGSEAFTEELSRLQQLYDYLFDFWRAVDDGAKTLRAGEELVFDDVPVAVVEYREGRIVLRALGQNKRFTLRDMPTKLVLKLAARSMMASVPANKVFLGTYHAMDAKGDRAEARRLWEEAQRGGQDVSLLLPELTGKTAQPAGPAESPPPAAPAELPDLPAEAKMLLAAEKWTARRRGAIRWMPCPATQFATNSPDGHLNVRVPESERGDVQLLYGQRLSSDFECRVLLTNVPENQVFGLLPADHADGGHVVPLPAGTVLVEFGRAAGKFRARVNREEVTVDSAQGTPATLNGCLGFTLPRGGSADVALLQLRFSR
jgi:hypothetical protein